MKTQKKVPHELGPKFLRIEAFRSIVIGLTIGFKGYVYVKPSYRTQIL
jgi:hypothetical protein